jgi:hypothetical protein
MGPSPSGRSGHVMASHGTRVFVLGGESSADPQADETMLIHVLDTSTYFLLSLHLDKPPRLKYKYRTHQVPEIRGQRCQTHLRGIMRRLVERMWAMEAEIASARWNEKCLK